MHKTAKDAEEIKIIALSFDFYKVLFDISL